MILRKTVAPALTIALATSHLIAPATAQTANTPVATAPASSNNDNKDNGSSNTGDANKTTQDTCIATGLGAGLPLLLLIPAALGMGKGHVEAANVQLQKTLGIFKSEDAAKAAANNLGMVVQGLSALASLGLGIFGAIHLSQNCTGNNGSSKPTQPTEPTQPAQPTTTAAAPTTTATTTTAQTTTVSTAPATSAPTTVAPTTSNVPTTAAPTTSATTTTAAPTTTPVTNTPAPSDTTIVWDEYLNDGVTTLNALWPRLNEETALIVGEFVGDPYAVDCTASGLPGDSYLHRIYEGGTGLGITLSAPVLSETAPAEIYKASVTCGNQTIEFDIIHGNFSQLYSEALSLNATQGSLNGKEVTAILFDFAPNATIYEAPEVNLDHSAQYSDLRTFIARKQADGSFQMYYVAADGQEVAVNPDFFHVAMNEGIEYNYGVFYQDGSAVSGTTLPGQ